MKKIEFWIDSLVAYALVNGLAAPEDTQVLVNRLLDILRKDDYEPAEGPLCEDIETILAGLLDYAVEKGLCNDDITSRDIFDTRIMGAVTPMPREIIRDFLTLLNILRDNPTATFDELVKSVTAASKPASTSELEFVPIEAPKTGKVSLFDIDI